MRSKPTQHQISSGGVILRKGPSGHDVALIRKTIKNSKTIWCLPKGWVEPGETLEAGALREVREETGLQGEIIAPIGQIGYKFYSREDHTAIDKTVYFYLMNCIGGDTDDHDEEAEMAAWFPLEKAEASMFYSTEIDIIRKARELLKKV